MLGLSLSMVRKVSTSLLSKVQYLTLEGDPYVGVELEHGEEGINLSLE